MEALYIWDELHLATGLSSDSDSRNVSSGRVREGSMCVFSNYWRLVKRAYQQPPRFSKMEAKEEAPGAINQQDRDCVDRYRNPCTVLGCNQNTC